jgi:hypothetical protein
MLREGRGCDKGQTATPDAHYYFSLPVAREKRIMQGLGHVEDVGS